VLYLCKFCIPTGKTIRGKFAKYFIEISFNCFTDYSTIAGGKCRPHYRPYSLLFYNVIANFMDFVAFLLTFYK